MCGSQRQDTEHQVAEHLIVTAHTHEAGAVTVLERAVDAFGGASLLKADVFGQSVASTAPGARFVRVRGHDKVLCHLMFGILALAAEQLMRLVT